MSKTPMEDAIRACFLLPRDAPQAALRSLAGSPIVLDGHALDADAQVVCKVYERLTKGPAYLRPLSEVRREYDLFARAADEPGTPLPRVDERYVPGPRGPIRVRVSYPRVTGEPMPAVVYFHGGGHVVGSIDTCDALCRKLSRVADVVSVNVDYRLAPEHPMPAAVDDCFAAFLWTVEHAGELGVDPARIAVAGDSAGGNLAAVTAQLARDAGGPTPRYQLLFYPLTDAFSTLPSRQTFHSGFFLDTPTIEWFVSQYVPKGKEYDFRASPLRRPDLSGLPPARVVTAGFDPLRDEGRAYASRLARAGVVVEDVCEPCLIHGFASMAMLRGGVRQVLESAHALGRALHGD